MINDLRIAHRNQTGDCNRRDYTAWNKPDVETEDSKVICQHFGCGRQLTIRQKLYGNLCNLHSTKGIVIGLVNDNFFGK